MPASPRFVLTPGGRIVTREDYEREQRFATDYARQQQMERANQEWLAARAARAGKGPGERCGTEGCTNDARWIPIRYGNAGSRVYRCVQCCDLVDHGDDL